jgi:hypothetical protein
VLRPTSVTHVAHVADAQIQRSQHGDDESHRRRKAPRGGTTGETSHNGGQGGRRGGHARARARESREREGEAKHASRRARARGGTAKRMVLTVFNLALSALVATAPARCPPVRAQAVTFDAIGSDVANWCISAGREQATVAVSTASTVAGALADFWLVAHALATEDGPVGRQRVLAFPSWSDVVDAQYFQAVLDHISDCGEVCDHIGDSMLIAGRHPTAAPHEEEPQAAPCPIIILRSFAQKEWGEFADENDGTLDPFAEMDVPDDDLFTGAGGGDRTKMSDDEVVASAREWSKTLVERIGLPAAGGGDGRGGAAGGGGVEYVVTASATGEEIFHKFWREAEALACSEASVRDALVLISPCFAPYNVGGYEAFASPLTDALSNLHADREHQLVFFHPNYELSDEDKANGVSFARIAPQPMAVILRTAHVENARRGVAVGTLDARTFVEVHEQVCGEAGPDGAPPGYGEASDF